MTTWISADLNLMELAAPCCACQGYVLTFDSLSISRISELIHGTFIRWKFGRHLIYLRHMTIDTEQLQSYLCMF